MVRSVLLMLIISTTGCGYHLTNTRTVPIGTASRIWVPFFSNESISPTAQTVLRRAFYEEFHALRGLKPATNEGAADLVMKARIVSYASSATSYNSIDQARQYNLDLNVELEVSKTGEKNPLWKGQLQASRQYPANKDLALQRNAEEQALNSASRIIAQKLISVLEESY